MNPPGPEEQLMRCFQDGDTASFDQLYLLLKGPLYTFLYRFSRDEQLSMDLVQDAFLALERSKHTYSPEKGRVKSYLFQIAYRLMLNKLKRRQRWRSLLPFLISEQATASPDDRLTIRDALLQLSAEQRAVILLTYYHDMPQKEIARILNIPLGTVKSRLHHGLKQLKTILEVENLDAGSF